MRDLPVIAPAMWLYALDVVETANGHSDRLKNRADR
jgi:hypothetical protein